MEVHKIYTTTSVSSSKFCSMSYINLSAKSEIKFTAHQTILYPDLSAAAQQAQNQPFLSQHLSPCLPTKNFPAVKSKCNSQRIHEI